MKENVILCVDDEEMVLRSLRRELNRALSDEYIIETAEGGEDALEVFEELLNEGYEIPLVIADQIMPGMKGDELLKRIHARSPEILKIMLTGQADMKAVTNAVNQANLYRYIPKPWENTDFCLTIKEAVHRYFQDKKLEEQHKALQKLYAQAQQEITERIRAEEALRKSETNIRAIVETAADGIITFDKQGIIKSFNPAAEQIFGYLATEIIGQNINTVIPSFSDVECDYYQGNIQDTNQEITPCIGHETRGQHKNGNIFPIDFTVSRIHIDKQQMFTGFVHDITERKRAEQERLQLAAIHRELTIAHDIQQGLLPGPKPDWPDFDVICYTVPAREVGGDFYSYHAFDSALDPSNGAKKKKALKCLLQTRKGKFALTIGDVSGKGVSASLLMATVLSWFNAALSFDFTSAERLAYLDRAILPYTELWGQNCALCYVEFDLTDVDFQAFKNYRAHVTLRVVNAGGVPPYVKRTDGSVDYLEIGGMPLGLGIGAKIGYQEVCTSLSTGDMVILTSDGVIEATTTTDEMFGFERLKAAITVAPTTNAQVMLSHLKTELANFVGEAEPYDDVTIVVLQV
jgi:PAS domain S-box-containing protein